MTHSDPTPTAKPLMLAREVGLYYGATPAILDVTLPIYPATITGIVGPSGCGKSSFLSTLNRLDELVVGARVSGQVLFHDQDVRGRGQDVVALRRRVGMIFQRPNPFPMSIKRNMELGLKAQGLRSRAALEAASEQALQDVGLWDEVKDRLKRSALELSGGQQQRLCIARAIALKPEVLLMDEPCSALDPRASAVVEALIKELGQRYALVVVTHNLAQARRVTQRLAVLWGEGGAGRLVEYGATAALFEAPQEAITAEYLRGQVG